MKVFGITAPMTGSGKTTVTLAFLSRLKNSTGFKIGPDYIDGGLSSRVTGNRTWNIDRWIQGKAYSGVLAGAASKYDYGVVEGVMGLYDSGSPINLSTYYYFRKFSIPYVLVIDVSKLAESAYYIAKSFITHLTLGVVINRYASQRHLEMVSKPFTEHGIPILGAIPREDRFTVPERHLGLHTGQEMDDILEKASMVSNYLDMEFIENLPERDFQQPSPARISGGGKNIWIALDRAFNFYYADSIWALERIGKVNYFSPVSGEYPENPDMVYFGGGYPELYAPELSANHALSEMIRDYSESGGNIIAECGGLMYLEKKMETESGVYSMGGVFNGTVKKNERLTLSYTQLKVVQDSLLFRKGEVVRGHEFHYSSIVDHGEKSLVNIIGKGIDGTDGLKIKNTLGSYSHFSLNRYSKRLERKINGH
ncbi:MAG: cobyrinate a,c-diamide synthase [Candidatus Thermoplasmatota archaeon]|jgi:cobyrinic acid a,c-diamide synthase|nr:cobyrinate a,c-diamide synthase [Candidatus Thermoplasmatota archaeon]